MDITQGSNGSYSAAIGPDPCTGLGVPNGTALASLFSGLPSALPHSRVICRSCASAVKEGPVFDQLMLRQFPRLATAQHRKLLRVSPAELVAIGATNVTSDSITLL